MTCNSLLLKHPDLYDILRCNPQTRIYKRYEASRIVEQWTRNNDGAWIDTTEQAQLEEQIALDAKEIDRLKRRIDANDATESTDVIIST